jgi:hypothetical protein
MVSGNSSSINTATETAAGQDQDRGTVIFQTGWSSGTTAVIVAASLFLLFLFGLTFVRLNDLDQMSKQNNETMTSLLTTLAERNTELRSQPTVTQNPASAQQPPFTPMPADTGRGVGSATPSSSSAEPNALVPQTQPLPSTNGASSQPTGQP